MKAFEIMDDLFSLARPGDFSQTCDTCKAGSPQAEVTKVAVSMFATPEVIRQASRWGAQMLIVHEPACYNHMDFAHNEALEREKRRFLAESGLTVYRFHDHCHAACPDIISAGELEARCRKCMRLDVSDTRALARVLDRQKAEYHIVDDTHADLYTELPVTELVLALDKERCAVRSIKERDESLENFYMHLIGGVRHA